MFYKVLKKVFYLVSERGLQKKGLAVRSRCKPPGVLGQNTVFGQGVYNQNAARWRFFVNLSGPTVKTICRELFSSLVLHAGRPASRGLQRD